MPQQDEYLDIITKYLNNPTDESLRRAIDEFRANSSENDLYFLEMEKVWNYAAKAAPLEVMHVNEAASRLYSNIPDNSHKAKFRLNWFTGIAASLLVTFLAYLWYSQNQGPRLLTKTTLSNQIDSVKLADGSTIVLAENSQLQYPEVFDSGARQVVLTKGQAFFKITKDKIHPFKVQLKQSDITVLGTSFNIRLTDSTIVLGVRTGKVVFKPYKDGATSVLSAGQGLSYDIAKRELSMQNSANQEAWMTKELQFVDTPLEEVCKQLTNYYGVQIQLLNGKKTEKKLNANFKDQALNDVLIILNETYNIKVIREHNKINLITPKQIN